MTDFLRELLALVHPDRLLRDPRADGAGVRVGIVDSGIDRASIAAAHPEAPTIEGAVFGPGLLPYSGTASTPHGTTVADVVLTVAPRATLFSADVFGPSGGGDASAVVAAIYHCLDVWNCRIINLSLGVTESRLQPATRRHDFRRAVEEAYHRGAVIVAAAHNDHPFTKSYPAAFAPPLLSVDKAIFADPLEVRYQPREEVEFQAHARGYRGPFAREPATSWAAPHLAGVAARLLSLCPELRPFEIKALLSFMSRARNSA
ncbi:MAG: S8 family serine peptidase [Gemmataceae bacterium]|nr:S8 family serine peptidase [Gemmataceae bacterium]